MLQGYLLLGFVGALANLWIMLHHDSNQPASHHVLQFFLMLFFWIIVVPIFWYEGVKKNRPFAA